MKYRSFKERVPTKKVLRYIFLLTLIVSIIVYISLLSPKVEGVIENYTDTSEFSAGTLEITEKKTYYLYENSKTSRAKSVYLDSKNFVVVDNGPQTKVINIEPVNQLHTSISVQTMVRQDYPLVDGYRLIGMVVLKPTTYNVYISNLNRGDFLFAESLPVEHITHYDEYLNIPLTTGTISSMLFLVTFLRFHSDYGDNEYDQGYTRKRPGKRERY